jgi:hypothetical protein
MTVYKVCSNSATIGAGPGLSTFRLARSRPELWASLCATVQKEADRAATSTTLERKRSGFEVKTPHLAL